MAFFGHFPVFNQASKVGTTGLRLSQFSMAIFEHETKVGGANMHMKYSYEAVISSSTVQSLQMVSLAAETKGGQILVAFLPKHGLRSDLSVSNLKEFSWGNMPQDFPSLFTCILSSVTNCHTGLK